MKRLAVALAVALAVLLVSGVTAWAAFSHELTSPQTITSGTWITTPPNAGPPVATGELAIRAPQPQGNNGPQMTLALNIANRRATPINLSEVTIRYWFTAEPASLGTTAYYCGRIENPFTSNLDCANVTRNIGTVSPPLPDADHYLEVGFRSEAGTLAPNQEIHDLQPGMNNNNVGSFNTMNDWSSRGLTASVGNAYCITAYIGGTLAWGQEPGDTSHGHCV